MKVDTKKRVHTEPALKVKSPSKKLFNLSARQEYHQGEKRVPLLSFLNYQNPKFEITYDAIVDNMRHSLVNKKNSI